MKHLSIFCVVYNSYMELENYISSIEKAAKLVDSIARIDLFIADTSTENNKHFNRTGENIKIEYYKLEMNLGYLGGISYLMKKADKDLLSNYEFTIISNVDVLLSEDFFIKLINIEVISNIGWITPQIHSLYENRDRNPKMLKRPSSRRIELLINLFKYPIIYNTYNSFIYPIRKKNNAKNPMNSKIYAGHGSFMIFTQNFMKLHHNFYFPSFLFGEEIFFAELCRGSNLEVFYIPELKIIDIDHASTGKLASKNYCKLNYNSLKKLKHFFEDE